MKSALKKSVVSTSISLILASGMAAFAAHAADDVKLKATKTNVAFSDFTPTEYSTKGKPNIIVLTMDDLGYGQLPFDKGSFDPKTMENREVVDTYKIGIDKAIEAAQKFTVKRMIKSAKAVVPTARLKPPLLNITTTAKPKRIRSTSVLNWPNPCISAR